MLTAKTGIENKANPCQIRKNAHFTVFFFFFFLPFSKEVAIIANKSTAKNRKTEDSR